MLLVAFQQLFKNLNQLLGLEIALRQSQASQFIVFLDEPTQIIDDLRII